MEMSPLISKMLIFVVLMVIGYVCARTKFAGREFTRDASKMVINVFMSATIITPCWWRIYGWTAGSWES